MRTHNKTTKFPKAQENAGDQVVIDFSFASDWLRNWRDFSGPITERSKQNQSLKIALFLNLVKSFR